MSELAPGPIAQLTLDDYLNFRNGKTSPPRGEKGSHQVFGSNGSLGWSSLGNVHGPVVVIGRVGSFCGSLHYSPANVWVTDNAIACTPRNSAETRYWYYALQTLDLNGRSSGSGQPLLNQTVLGTIPFEAPSLSARMAIAEVLGALDDKIAANARLVAVAEALAVTFAGSFKPSVAIEHLVRHSKQPVVPLHMHDRNVAHFSLPAYDVDKLPEITAPTEILSSKFAISQPAVLISKLNPRFPRVWNVAELPSAIALASTEFLVLDPLWCSTTVLWAILSQEEFAISLDGKASGTSGSHQRVRPADLLATLVGDPREMPEALKSRITSIGLIALAMRAENRLLAATRDALLPQLMSGKLRVKDAEKSLAGVL